MAKIGIVGGTGYTGVELLRILCVHPEVELSVITSALKQEKGSRTAFPTCGAMWTSALPNRMPVPWRNAIWCSSPRPTVRP